MPKFRTTFADALARMMFGRSLPDLNASERAQLDFLRAPQADATDDEWHEQLASQSLEDLETATIH
jgi:hypothetical protein